LLNNFAGKFIYTHAVAHGTSIRAESIDICGICMFLCIHCGQDAQRRLHGCQTLLHLDQSVVGNPAHDLLRLGLSLATSARGSDLPGVTTAKMLEEVIVGYQEGLLHPSRQARKNAPAAKTIKCVLDKALKRNWRKLAAELIEDVSPSIPLGKCFWPVSTTEMPELERLFEAEGTRKLITCLRQRDSDDHIRIADAAFWVKGCSSLGRLRYAVLVKIGQKKKGTEGFCLIDIKEAAKTAAPHLPTAQCLATMPCVS
jgi:uncharacterized protein (DUF2252 family)